MSLLLRRSLHGITLAIAVLSVCLLLAVGVAPRAGRFQVMTVLTGSMAPDAPRGSLAVIAPKPRKDLRVGDVLTYAIPVEDHHVVTHRVIHVADAENGGTIVRTKGDANPAADPWVAELQEPMVWTERFAVPHLGQVLAALRSPVVHRVGQLAPLVLAALLLLRVWRPTEGADDAAPA